MVLDNLIGNAWKYAGSRKGAVIEFDVTEVDGKPACFVRDNGPGFDMALADKLFLPFQRLAGTDVEGHGIGLATVERIVRRHSGRIWAESKPGEGATFFFTLD
jgi:signal transduction histidine kinase